MAGASPGQVVAAKKQLDSTHADPHSLADVRFSSTDNEDILKRFGQDRAAAALNFVSTKPDATAVKYTPSSKLAVGKDAHAIADEQGRQTGEQAAQEVRAAGGTGAEAAVAGNDARQNFKHYARGQSTEEEKLIKPGQQVGQDPSSDLLADGQTEKLPEGRGKKQPNLNVTRKPNGLREVGLLDPHSQGLAAAQSTEQTPQAQRTEQRAQAQGVDRDKVRAALAAYRDESQAQQSIAAVRSKEPYKLGNFRVPTHSNLTIVSVAQEQENLA